MVNRFHIVAIFADQERAKIPIEHRLDRITASPSGVGVPSPFRPVSQSDCGCNQLEMGMTSMRRIG